MITMHRFSKCLIILGLCGLLAACGEEPVAKRPNIILIMADDMGFTDIGAFGGEIRTPNIDALAASGNIYTRFFASPVCSPTRAMLLTGVDSHLAGLGTMAERRWDDRLGTPGYEGYLNDSVVTFATLLKDTGYRTYMAGKWHLGMKPEQRPSARGFEKSFALMQGGASHFADMRPLISKIPKAGYFKDGKKVETLPADFYSSRYYTDQIIENIASDHDKGAPFFAWLAFTAPHWPLQVPDPYLDLYKGEYDEGYDVIRRRRAENAAKVGILSTVVNPLDQAAPIPAWNSLDEGTKTIEARRMEIYAAMVERMDHHIGRLVTHLKDIGEFENTVIMFMSDNGAEGKDVLALADNRTWVPETFDTSANNMGRINSYVSQGQAWAQASSGPLKLYKAFTTDGGIRVPMIVSMPGRSGHVPQVYTHPVTVRDVAPTIMELAGTAAHGEIYRGRPVIPMSGRSLVPTLKDAKKPVHSSAEVFGWELLGHKAVLKGNWKLVSVGAPLKKDGWQLFNIETDPGETNDLAGLETEKLAEMILAWQAYAAENNVLPLTSSP